MTLAAMGLDSKQVGHLRHIDNLSRQLPNDWSSMQGRGVNQEDFGGYRFQLSYMAYAIALTHIHRLPAAPGLFKPMFERLFEKLLLPEVWRYWHDVSRGGSVFNLHLVDTYREEWDPVRKDNIMYSAYVQSLALLYHYLFRDDRYAKPGAITFKQWSFFWGGPPKTFVYDESSLNEHLYWLMVESGYIGVACEPNCIFQICNQPAILGFRLHDLITGGSRAAEVVKGYQAAWAGLGRVGDNGHYNLMVAQDTKQVRQNVSKAPWADAWVGSLMNMWNRDFVREHYPRQIAELVHAGPDGTFCVAPSPRGPVMGETVITDDCDFGWVTVWTSEMGDRERLDGLLAHADRFMSPRWSRGGLYYPRNDQLTDDAGHRTLMEAHTGNVLLAYARLNVPDGLWSLYNEPLPESFFTDPALVEVDVDVEIERAFFSDGVLSFTLRGEGEVVIGRLGDRPWVLFEDGRAISRGKGDLRVTAGPRRELELRLA